MFHHPSIMFNPSIITINPKKTLLNSQNIKNKKEIDCKQNNTYFNKIIKTKK